MKAIVGFITVFLGIAAAREVDLGFWVEAPLLAAVAFFTVWVTPNES